MFILFGLRESLKYLCSNIQVVNKLNGKLIEGNFMFMCWCRFPEVIAVIVETELGFFCLWRFQMNTLQFIFK